MPSNIDRGRLHPRDTFWDGKRKPFLIGVCFTFLLLQILFLGNLSYLYGVVFKSSYRTHNLEILNVNLETSTSTVQGAVDAAYSRLQGDGFFSLQSRPSTQYNTVDAAREAVCKGHFWAAVVINEGASSRLSSALAGGEAAEIYDSSDAATLVINSAKYSTASLGEVVGNLQTLLAAASQAYTSVGRNASSTLDISSVAAVTAFRSPISSKTVDIMPTNQGPRVLYNTVSMVFPIIQQFFFLMALNGLSTTYKLYTSLRVRYAVFMRGFLGTVYTFISSLCMAGYMWAFREDWGVEAGQFVLTWMVLWLYMFINFGLLDTLTAFVPMSFVPFFMSVEFKKNGIETPIKDTADSALVTWVVINVASTIYPLALTAGFYHWGVALPAYNTYNLLVEVWTHGCNPMHAQCLGVLLPGPSWASCLPTSGCGEDA
ncbi:hypothetical protein Slin15195_G033030 [Septoria linicola]|uniref:DUF3533 domain-containing protein n=1 Tax=Septoria linicola TaxID=215465 RepID=A0A9Q9AIF5_9PEZI|nr:hypothetical protein Slin15195_G033030 [Septoria linicola]